MLGGLSFHGAAVSAQALFLGAQLLAGLSMARGAVSLIWRGLQALKEARTFGLNMGVRDRPRLKRLGNKSLKEPLWKSWKKKCSASRARGGTRSHLSRRRVVAKRSPAMALNCSSFMDAFHSFIGRPSVKNEAQISGSSLKEACMDDSGLPEDLAELEGNSHEGDYLVELITRQNYLPGLAFIFEVQSKAEGHLLYSANFSAVLKSSVPGFVESARASGTITSSFWSYSLPGTSDTCDDAENIELSLAAAGIEMGRWYTVSLTACERFKDWSREGKLLLCLEAYTGLRENICRL